MECENNYNTYDEDVEILFSVGRRFLTGNGLEKDEVKGKEMLSQAAMMGHSLAQQLLERYNAEHVDNVEELQKESNPLTEMLELMRERGVDEEHISLMKHCGIDLESWLHGFDETDAAVLETVDLVKNHPLVPRDVVVKGYIMDSTTGKLTPIEG